MVLTHLLGSKLHYTIEFCTRRLVFFVDKTVVMGQCVGLIDIALQT